MKFVKESIEEVLNEGRQEMYYVVIIDPDMESYGIMDKNEEIVWDGRRDEMITFLMRNAGVANSYEAKNVLVKADKFAGKSMTSGDTVEKKGPFGRTIDKGEGAKVLGAPIMIQPFMLDKEISKGRFEAPRKTPDQVAKKQSREKREEEIEGQETRKARFGIPDDVYKKREREERELAAMRRNPFNEMKGGRGEHLKIQDVDQDQVEVGREVEYEHTDDPKIALDIALDHLAEIPDYYTKLVQAGLVDEEDALKLYNERIGDEDLNIR